MEQDRSDLHLSSVGEASGMDKVFIFTCPYLGMLKDPITSLAFPASANHCFRLESPTGVDLSHQEEYCLTDRHPGCQVFQMASAATADAKPVAPLTVLEMRKRRITLYAFPLILILILLAAIIWWPAPGTSIQESLVLGAQNDREASGNTTLNGKPVPQPDVTDKSFEIPSPDAVGEPAATVSLNESGDQAEQEGVGTSTNESARNGPTGNGQIQASAETDMVPLPDQQAEAARTAESNTETAIAPAQSTEIEAPNESQISSKETSSANSEQDISTETSEASPDSTSSSEESPSSSTEESVSDDSLEEAGPETGTDEAVAAIEEDTDESPAVVITDLPVISSEILAVTAPSEESITTNSAGELVTLVGPTISTSLSLRDDSEDVNVLTVYQDPTTDSALLSLIERKQFVTLLARDSSGSWLKVRLNSGIEGWIDAVQSEAGEAVNSLPLEGDATVSEPTGEQSIPAVTSYPVIRSAFVDTGALHVRSGPGVAYEAITVISSGELIGLIGRDALGPWVRVRLDSGLEGWVNSMLLAQVS